MSLIGFNAEANVWTDPFTLQTIVAPDEPNLNYQSRQDVEITMNDSGQSVAAWKKQLTLTSPPFAAYFDGYVWTSPTQLLPDAIAGLNNRLETSINESGVAAVTWTNNLAGVNDVYLSIYANGAWSPSAIQVSTMGISPTASSPKNAIDNEGNILVVWITSSAAMPQVLASRFNSSGAVLESEFALSAGNVFVLGAGDNTFQLSMNAEGEAMYVWAEGAAAATTIIKYAYFDGTSWTITDQVLYGTPGPYSDMTVSLNDSGLAAACWVETVAMAHKVWASLYDGANWSSPFLLDTSTVGMDRSQIGMDSRGNCIAVWMNQTVPGDPPQFQIKSASYSRTSGTWSSPVTLADPAYGSQLAANSRGAALISWSAGISTITPDFSTDTGSLQVSTYGGGNWSLPVTISSPDGIARANQVFLTSSGNGAIAWRLGQPIGPATPTEVLIQVAFFNQNLGGRQVPNRFPSQIDYVNALNWSAIWSPTAFLYYSITRNGEEIAQVPSSQWTYQDHYRTKGVQTTYSVTGITPTGPSMTYPATF